jgi:hypothetical protein
MIDKDETLDQVRRVTAEPITRLTPDDVREVNRLLTCAERGHYEKQQREIESTWKDEFPGFPKLLTSEHCLLLDLSHTEKSHLCKRHPLVTLSFKEKSDARHAWT